MAVHTASPGLARTANPIRKMNDRRSGWPELVYDLLFDCASATLLELGRGPKRLDGQLGITAVLHTWTRDLALHPHVHCIVTGGALSADGTQWHSARPKFLFPVAVMREFYRGKVMDALKQANEQGRLQRPDGRPWLEPHELRRLMRKLRRMKWVVYCKRPFGALGCKSFRELCESRLDLSVATANRLVDIVSNLTRAQALKRGQTRANALLGLADAIPEHDTATSLSRKRKLALPTGDTLDVTGASTKQRRRQPR